MPAPGSDPLRDQLLKVPEEVAPALETSRVNQGDAVSRFFDIGGRLHAEKRGQVDPILRP